MIAVPQARSIALQGYVEVARFAGLDPYAMLQAADISPAQLEDPETRLPAARVAGLVEQSARASGCESFGLLMQECRSYESLGPVAVLFERLETIREVVVAASEYRRHMNDVVQFTLQEGESAVLKVELLPNFASAQIADMTVAMTHVLLTGASRRLWHPDAVHFRHSPPSDTTAFQRFFPAPIMFDSNFDGFEFSADLLDLPLPGASKLMADNVRRLLDTVELPPEDAPVTERVCRAVTLLLPLGRASLEAVAQAVDTSPRDLQRKLEREGSSFGELLTRVRRQLSQNYLSNVMPPISIVAELTGYASTASFSRWFVGEFGLPPAAWRRSFRRTIQGMHVTAAA